MKPFFDACKFGDLELVKDYLWEKNVDLNQPFKNMTPLYAAVGENQVEIVKELLSHSQININMGSAWGRTPLWVACNWGHLECVQRLIAHKDIDVEIAMDGYTPFERAVKNNRHLVVLAMLLDGRSKITSKCHTLINSPKLQKVGKYIEDYEKNPKDFCEMHSIENIPETKDGQTQNSETPVNETSVNETSVNEMSVNETPICEAPKRIRPDMFEKEPPKKSGIYLGKTVVCKYRFTKTHEHDLDILPDEQLEVLRDEGEWLWCINTNTSKRGFIPTSYVAIRSNMAPFKNVCTDKPKSTTQFDIIDQILKETQLSEYKPKFVDKKIKVRHLGMLTRKEEVLSIVIDNKFDRDLFIEHVKENYLENGKVLKKYL